MTTTSRRFLRAVGLLALALGLTSCSTTRPDGSPERRLRVGLTPDLAPLVYLENGQLTGLEMDLARQLAVALGRPIEVTSMPWKSLLNALQQDKIDIIMGGISITQAREVQVAFTDPWLESGLMALVRASDRDLYRTPADLPAHAIQIGVMPGTTSDTFVQKTYPRLRRVPLAIATDAPNVLQRRGIDAFVHDLPAVIWLHSRNESGTAIIREPLQREQIAWAVRPDDTALRESINGILRRWRQDGTLHATILKWIPYYDRLTATAP
jgi:ABC-type amino acid transport substrate-binding protein